MLLKEKDGKIAELRAHIGDLETRILELSKYSVSQKVYVEDSYLPTLTDLIQQLREVELPLGGRCSKATTTARITS